MADFPYLYRNSSGEAQRLGQAQMHEDSFRLNVTCARAIEQAIRDHFDEPGDGLKDGCAESILDKFGFKRVNYVLANTLEQMGCPYLVSDDSRSWGKQTYVPPDGKYNRYFTVDTAASLLDAFIQQTKELYQSLELFGPEHCLGDGGDYTGKVLVIHPEMLRESCWDAHNQLWQAYAGFGCSPTAFGQAVYAVCLGDGEEARWERSDFIGVLKDEFLPDWAMERLEVHEQGPSMDGMS